MGHLGHGLTGDNVTQKPRGRVLSALAFMGHLGQIVTLVHRGDPPKAYFLRAGDAGKVRGIAAKACTSIQYIYLP